jgi:hypothetical protein
LRLWSASGIHVIVQFTKSDESIYKSKISPELCSRAIRDGCGGIRSKSSFGGNLSGRYPLGSCGNPGLLFCAKSLACFIASPIDLNSATLRPSTNTQTQLPAWRRRTGKTTISRPLESCNSTILYV